MAVSPACQRPFLLLILKPDPFHSLLYPAFSLSLLRPAVRFVSGPQKTILNLQSRESYSQTESDWPRTQVNQLSLSPLADRLHVSVGRYSPLCCYRKLACFYISRQLQYITGLCVLAFFSCLFRICTSLQLGVALAGFTQHAALSLNYSPVNTASVARVVRPSLVETVKPQLNVGAQLWLTEVHMCSHGVADCVSSLLQVSQSFGELW